MTTNVSILCPKCGTKNTATPGQEVSCAECHSKMIVKDKKVGRRARMTKWQSECNRAVFFASELLRLARRRASVSAVIEIIRTAPRNNAERENPNLDAFFVQCFLDAHRLEDRILPERHPQLRDYFMEHLLSMKPARRRLLEASIAGSLIGYGADCA